MVKQVFNAILLKCKINVIELNGVDLEKREKEECIFLYKEMIYFVTLHLCDFTVLLRFVRSVI